MDTLQNLFNEIFIPVDGKIAKSRAKLNAKHRTKSKKLADELNIILETARDGQGWYCWIDVDDAELADGRYCTSWVEVFNTLEEIKSNRGL